MAITPIDPYPPRNTPEFKTWVESFFATNFPTAIAEMNTAIEAFNTNDLRGTSTTAYTPNVTGNKVFVTQSGKSWVPGMWVTGGYTSGGSEYWGGPIVSYSGTNLTVNILVNSGTATSRSSWQIAFSPPVTDLVGDKEIVVHTGNGYGSTNTRRRRYTTKSKDTASGSITYADSSTLGATFTINANGMYAVRRSEKTETGAASCGIALNASSGTTSYVSLPFAERLAAFLTGTASPNQLNEVSFVRYFTAGDVIVPHDTTSLSDGTSDSCLMIVTRLK